MLVHRGRGGQASRSDGRGGFRPRGADDDVVPEAALNGRAGAMAMYNAESFAPVRAPGDILRRLAQ